MKKKYEYIQIINFNVSKGEQRWGLKYILSTSQLLNKIFLLIREEN